MVSLQRMSNRIDTLEATLAALKRLEKKGVRSVYLDGVELDNIAPERATRGEPAASPKTGTSARSQGLAPSIPLDSPSLAQREPCPSPPAPLVAASPETVAGLAELAQTVSVCTRCALHATRKQTVFGVGNPRAKLMFIGSNGINLSAIALPKRDGIVRRLLEPTPLQSIQRHQHQLTKPTGQQPGSLRVTTHAFKVFEIGRHHPGIVEAERYDHHFRIKRHTLSLQHGYFLQRVITTQRQILHVETRITLSQGTPQQIWKRCVSR